MVFVPQIAILFLALGVLEDSGYLARGAMLVDRLLAAIGLNGKSFVPLLSGNCLRDPGGDGRAHDSGSSGSAT
jgi:Fe2+ transport system protein B